MRGVTTSRFKVAVTLFRAVPLLFWGGNVLLNYSFVQRNLRVSLNVHLRKKNIFSEVAPGYCSQGLRCPSCPQKRLTGCTGNTHYLLQEREFASQSYSVCRVSLTRLVAVGCINDTV